MIAHLRECGLACEVHKAALKKVEIYNFTDAFPHHVYLLWLHVGGLSKTMISSGEFRDFVRGYEPRATFPHPSTINHR